MIRFYHGLLLVGLLLAGVGCGGGSPTAPAGTSVNPAAGPPRSNGRIHGEGATTGELTLPKGNLGKQQ